MKIKRKNIFLTAVLCLCLLSGCAANTPARQDEKSAQTQEKSAEQPGDKKENTKEQNTETAEVSPDGSKPADLSNAVGAAGETETVGAAEESSATKAAEDSAAIKAAGESMPVETAEDSKTMESATVGAEGEPAAMGETGEPAAMGEADKSSGKTATQETGDTSAVSQVAGSDTGTMPDSGSASEGQPDSGSATGNMPEAGSEAESLKSEQQIQTVLQGMSLEAKVAQMFVLLPEQLTGMGQVTEAGEGTRAALAGFPVGGLLYMEGNLESYEQTRTLLANTQQISYEITGLPMLTFVDEEGGIVTRISGRFPEVPWIESMAAYGARGSAEEAFQTGQIMGSYLADLGFTCDCAPVADVLTNPYNTVIGERSFGSDPELVASMAASLGSGLESAGVTAVYKHFPGHGGTAEDTHEGYSMLEKTKEELYACDLIPFIRAIENGARILMTAHITLPNVAADGLPASLSPEITTGLLREELGYNGLIMTDALNMGAVANQFTSAEAAILAIRAGADLILMPADPFSAYQAVLDAVYSGEITEERINESLYRILKLKLFV